MQILVVTNMWPTADRPMFGIFVKRNVEALRRVGWDVAVVAPRSFGNRFLLLRYALLLVWAALHAIKTRPRLVVGHYLYPTALIARVAARIAGCPFVVVAHGTDVMSVGRSDPIARLCRSASRSADAFIAVSKALLEQARSAGLVGVDRPAAAIHMGVDTTVFRPHEGARNGLGIEPSLRLVLYAGNLVPSKGLDVLIDAFSLLRSKGIAERLVIIGAGPEAPSLRRKAAETFAQPGKDGAECVQFKEPVTQEELARWLSAADVVVLPSRREGLGLVLLEAMACGTPCVGTRVGGIGEVVIGEEVGELADPQDAESLADALGKVLGKGKPFYSEACVRWAASNSCDAMAAKMVGFLAQTVDPALSVRGARDLMDPSTTIAPGGTARD